MKKLGRIEFEDRTAPGSRVAEWRRLRLRDPVDPLELSGSQLLHNHVLPMLTGRIYISHSSIDHVFPATVATVEAFSGPPAPEIAFLERRVSQLERDVQELKQSKPSERGPSYKETIHEVATVLGKLQQSYDIEDGGSVVGHFLGRPHFVELVIASVDRIRELFGGRPTLKCDPEGNLIIGMPTNLPPSLAESNYSKFLREWWIPRERGVAANAILVVEY